ncbi:hypothetical protein PoB_001068600 [Plakobranchus ocellatus]|uniref:Uncharacterized protein n=1 Tax=Plakobranchus ocellatus TaxID=259542 RepID=A0AAV3YLM5_9GAST|nr:hypothetical protein PoB_001068600 [Plakobranchus ocellatus]
MTNFFPDLSTTPTTTEQPTTKALVKDFVWTLVNVKQRVLVSHELELVIMGGPNVDNTGVILDSNNKYIRIPNIKDSCLTDPSVCIDGVTIEIVVKLTTLEENSIIFTSGGEVPDQPGITLLYRFGQVHVIVSTTLQSWYVTLPKQIIWTNNFCKVQVSWTTTTEPTTTSTAAGAATTVRPQPMSTFTGTCPAGCFSPDVCFDRSTAKATPTPTVNCITTEAEGTTTMKTVTRVIATPETTSTATTKSVTEKPTTTKTPTSKATTAKITAATSTTTTKKPPTTPKIPATTPTTPKTTPTTSTTTTTTTTTPTTTTRATTTLTTTTTPTTTTTATTTLPPCPEEPKSLVLSPEVDINNQGVLICSLAQTPSPGLEIRLTFRVQGQRRTWSQTIEAPDRGAAMPIADMGVELMNKRVRSDVYHYCDLPCLQIP